MMRSTSNGVKRIIGRNVKRNVSILLCVLTLLAAWSCSKTPEPAPEPDDQKEQPEPKPDPKPEPEPEPEPKDVAVMTSFTEDFSSRESEYLTFSRRTDRDDFRYYSAFPSLSERGATILMLRLDPADAAGEGVVVASRDYVYYGSVSARIRIPDIVAVQPKLGASADFSLVDQDSVWGTDEYTLSLRLADTGNLYLKGLHQDAEAGSEPVVEESVVAPSISPFNASSRFYIYGMDWTPDKLTWWVKDSDKSEKTVLSEQTVNVPTQPLRLQFRMYHSKNSPTKDNANTTQAPYYPFELEIDWIKYTPSEP